jgi:hypothetical protein
MRPMTNRQYRAALDKLGLKYVPAGRLFGYAKRQSQRFADPKNKTLIPRLVAKTVQWLLEGKITVEDLE